MSDNTIDVDGLIVGYNMVVGYRERVEQLEADNEKLKVNLAANEWAAQNHPDTPRVMALEALLREEVEGSPVVDEEIYNQFICQYCAEVADSSEEVKHSDDCWWLRANELLNNR